MELLPDRAAAWASPGSLKTALDRAVTSSEPLIFTQADPPYLITHVNAAWETLCGYQAHEAVGQTCRILQGMDTSQDALAVLHRALEQRQEVSVRLLNYTKKGVAFLNDLTVVPLSEDGSNVTHFRGALFAWRPPEALPEYPRAFETVDEASATHDTRSRMPTTFEEALVSSEFAAVVTERESPFRVTRVNEAWCQMCGFSSDEAVGQTLRILQGPGTCQLTLQALRQAAAACSPITVRLLNYNKVRAVAVSAPARAPAPPAPPARARPHEPLTSPSCPPLVPASRWPTQPSPIPPSLARASPPALLSRRRSGLS